MTTHGAIDLSQCEREPIHLSGAIQPHGVLLALDPRQLRIVQASDNTLALLGHPLEALLGRTLDTLLDAPTVASLQQALEAGTLRSLSPLPMNIGGRRFEGVVHRSSSVIVLELEPVAEVLVDPMHELYGISRDALARFQTIDALDVLLDAAAEEVRRCSGFDRVLVYRFERDEHGVVVSEARRPGIPSYLGLHYPASDIPKQARALYVKNWLRLISDVRYHPSPIVPARCPLTNAPLDLSHAMLRSVSPVHVEYLTNMGVSASMSISIVVRGELWGLIACHHYAPRLVPIEVRMACELIGQVLSLQIHALVDREASRAHAAAAATAGLLVEQMSNVGVVRALVAGRPGALDLVSAGGAAVWFDGELSTVGATPDAEELRALIDWLSPRLERGAYSTDSVTRDYPRGERFEDVASGVLAISLGTQGEHVIVWFRPEVVRTVRWGGDPEKVVEAAVDGLRLSPRRSFEVWKQSVRATSTPWTELEVDAATELARATIGVILRKSAQIARLNVELSQAVRARDDFMSMASHELRTPVTTLQLQLDRLARTATRSPEDRVGSPRIVDALEMASRQVERLERLVSAMLDVSRVTAGRLELQRTEGVDVGQIVRDVVKRFDAVLDGVPVAVVVEGEVTGDLDALRVEQIVANLLSNAIKYGQRSEISIRVTGDDEWISVTVRDRGIGIPPEEQVRLFQRFERARSASLHHGGFGLGLWIVKEFVVAHQGTITIDSRAGAGATFTVRLPREPRSEDTR